MTERAAPPELDWSPAGVIDRLALALLPWLEGEPCEPCLRLIPADAPQRCFPCIDHDHQATKPEPELEAEP